jgi:hypothetical protein
MLPAPFAITSHRTTAVFAHTLARQLSRLRIHYATSLPGLLMVPIAEECDRNRTDLSVAIAVM